MLIGTILVVSGVALAHAAAALTAPVAVIIVAWIVAGAGMGLMSPRTSALTLEMSAPESQGFNSSAMTVADSFGSALALAITGVLFSGL
ncbi:MFS transporter, partial [Pseudomonas sp. BGM005]|nr:MFS transporter [Pseudomonas sp. BG5]